MRTTPSCTEISGLDDLIAAPEQVLAQADPGTAI
jgi:hypothetical protein